MISLQPVDSREEWDEFVLESNGHPLQLWGWGETKAQHGWSVVRLIGYDLDKKPIGGAQVLIRRLPWPFRSLLYVPRGPVVSHKYAADFLTALANHVRAQFKAVALTIEPDWEGMPELTSRWYHSNNTILIPQTLILDLNKSEDKLLADMAKKTRQYIRKSAGEESLDIRQISAQEDIAACLAIYHETAARAGFRLHDDQYYYDIAKNMGEESPIFAVYKDNQPVAFLWLAISAYTAFELYGGMNDLGQELRANYALKWHAIRKMREWGIERYDMNGLVSDGVSNFKRGFAKHDNLLVGTFDKPLSSFYVLYAKVLPFGKRIVRLGKRN